MLEAPDKARKLAPYPDGTLNRIVLTMRPKKRDAQPVKSASTAALESSDDHTDGDDTASVIGVPAPLRAHCACVGKWARRFAEQCGLPQELIEDLEFAGRLHDLGKADRRFQIWLHDGDEIAESRSLEPLAKSGMQPNNRAAIRAARKRAGYPKGGRHELLSVALVRDNDVLKTQAHDWELVLHLVGTHHGYGRPFPPVVFDLKPETVTVEVESQLDRIGLLITEKMKNEKATGDVESQSLTASSDHGLERLNSGWVERFWRLVRRYGVWGLAYLEALLRLADYARSAEERNLYDK
jgi:CRISPR-associated endonuclease/helicase Cas3